MMFATIVMTNTYLPRVEGVGLMKHSIHYGVFSLTWSVSACHGGYPGSIPNSCEVSPTNKVVSVGPNKLL